ncbi:MAG: peptidylprolyl isomerase [Chloroflexota bacterium]|nr:peptidylprolyl isomerase [Chloroflexota bacterium]
MSLRVIGRLEAVALLVVLTACGPVLDTTTPSTNASVNTATTPVPTEPTVEPVSVPSPTPEPPLAARANGYPIYLADYERWLARYEASLPAQGIDPNSPEGQEKLAQHRDQVLNVMIEQALTEQAAMAAGIVVSDDEVNAYMQEVIAESGGEEAFRAKLAEWGETEEDAWREVRAQLIGMAMTQRVIENVPETAEHVHARHILVDTPQEAERILAQLQASADFATLARAYSQDISTRESGGDLGFFPRGILVAPEVEKVAFDLQPGQFSGVVTSVLGYHIVQVVDRDPAHPVSTENLRYLRNQAVQKWVEELWSQAVVERFIETTP